jgi:hypothetical protein
VDFHQLLGLEASEALCALLYDPGLFDGSRHAGELRGLRKQRMGGNHAANNNTSNESEKITEENNKMNSARTWDGAL